jgi:hypothetical protein
MNGANVVVSADHRAGETLQNNAESTGRDVEAAGLEPDTIRIWNPETVILQFCVDNEMFAAASTCVEAVGETAEGSDWHVSSFSQSMIISFYFFSGDGKGRSEFQISATTFHFPSLCFF